MESRFRWPMHIQNSQAPFWGDAYVQVSWMRQNYSRSPPINFRSCESISSPADRSGMFNSIDRGILGLEHYTKSHQNRCDLEKRKHISRKYASFKAMERTIEHNLWPNTPHPLPQARPTRAACPTPSTVVRRTCRLDSAWCKPGERQRRFEWAPCIAVRVARVGRERALSEVSKEASYQTRNLGTFIHVKRM